MKDMNPIEQYELEIKQIEELILELKTRNPTLKEIKKVLDYKYQHKASKQKWMLLENFPIEAGERKWSINLCLHPKKGWIKTEISAFDWGYSIEPEREVINMTEKEVVKEYVIGK